jgi:hypothetical protein
LHHSNVARRNVPPPPRLLITTLSGKTAFVIGASRSIGHAEAILARGDADVVAFGRHFTSHRDLPERFRHGLPRRVIAKERATEPPTLQRTIDRKPAEHHRRIGSGTLRRKRLTLLATAIAPDASALWATTLRSTATIRVRNVPLT